MSSRKETAIYKAAMVAVCAALSAVLSQISLPLPFTEVPLSLGMLAVLLVGGLLTPTLSLLTETVYLLLGAVGAPVFAGFRGGVHVLLGTTGGYLVGYVAAAWLSSWLTHGHGKCSVVRRALAMAAGMAACYLFGTVWFYVLAVSGGGDAAFLAIMAKCVFPFIPFDLIKMALATLLVRRLKKVLVL